VGRRWIRAATSVRGGTGTTSTRPSATSTTLALLRHGTIDVVGRIVESSNNALVVTVSSEDRSLHAIYKPVAGERPLFDFPVDTLSGREVAAWFVSEASGWSIVPPTVMRDGPFGTGMVQAFVEPDPAVDVVAMVVDDDPRLRRMAAFDAAINNTDRKGGHILPTDGGRRIQGVDHGVCFSVEPKLRTVLWGWRGMPFEPDEIDGLTRIRDALTGSLAADLAPLLSGAEIDATRERVERLLADGRFPQPEPDWPAVPWPPF
jgi:uncharacterized repeat protein (TIGR03843 family)